VKEMPDGLGIEFFLASKVPIEAAVRKTGGRHDLAYRDSGKTFPIEQTDGGFDNPRTRLLFVVCVVWHERILRWRPAVYPRAKDDLEHLLAIATVRRARKI
jgi:hypothetical protein